MTAPIDPVDQNDVRPTLESVSLLERSRIVGAGGEQLKVFNETTYPTADEVEGLIDQAVEAILSQLPTRLGTIYYERTRHQAALYTAILIEASFFREQIDRGSAAVYRDMLRTGMDSLIEDTGGQAGDARRTVDSIASVGEVAASDPFRALYGTMYPV